MKRLLALSLLVTSALGSFWGCGKGEGDDTSTKVKCDDGIFCNGVERMTTDGRCISPGPACDDGAGCTVDTCDEETQRCSHQLTGDCAACDRSDCTPDCSGRECGDDGCGAECGACNDPNTTCATVEGVCIPKDTPGTCRNPLPLLPAGTELDGKFTVSGDTTGGASEVQPSCNSVKAAEIVYTFDVEQTTGIDFRAEGIDSVLHLRKEDPATTANECLDDRQQTTIACSDDSSPPADGGSRITASLAPGKYYLVVDGYDDTSYGEFELDLRFVPGTCIPQCDGRFCGGSDGCGRDCGTCAGGEQCVNGSCVPDPCTPDCSGRDCGDDGCGGTCGSCEEGLHCLLVTGTCESYPECDHQKPKCDDCDDDEFCGTDCKCYPADGALPDLVVDAERLANEMVFETRNFGADSCAIQEDCVDAPGDRRILRFSVEAANQGQRSIDMPPVETRPDLFEYSPCHRHFHFRGFAVYELLDADGDVVLTGRKQAFCMTDSERYLEGPTRECRREHDCTNQGISPGWSDLYGNSLDCQWLDITDVPPGKYRVRVRVNPEHNVQEMSFDNNEAVVPVTID